MKIEMIREFGRIFGYPESTVSKMNEELNIFLKENNLNEQLEALSEEIFFESIKELDVQLGITYTPHQLSEINRLEKEIHARKKIALSSQEHGYLSEEVLIKVNNNKKKKGVDNMKNNECVKYNEDGVTVTVPYRNDTKKELTLKGSFPDNHSILFGVDAVESRKKFDINRLALDLEVLIETVVHVTSVTGQKYTVSVPGFYVDIDKELLFDQVLRVDAFVNNIMPDRDRIDMNALDEELERILN